MISKKKKTYKTIILILICSELISHNFSYNHKGKKCPSL